MPHDARKSLWDVFDAASFLIADNSDSTYEAFISDRRRLGSAQHYLLVFGEACRQLRDGFPDVAAQIPELNSAVGMRNVIAHEYSDDDYELVWQTIQKKLSPLRDRALLLYETTAQNSVEDPGNTFRRVRPPRTSRRISKPPILVV